jgi:hypothetical protein
MVTLSSRSNALKAIEGDVMDITYGDDEFLKYLKAQAGEVGKISGGGKGQPYYYSRTVRTKVGDNAGVIADGGSFGTHDAGAADLIKFPCVDMASMIYLSNQAREVGALVGPNVTSESEEMESLLADFALKMKGNALGQAKGWYTTVKTGGSSTSTIVYDPDLFAIGTRWNLYGVSSDTWTKDTGVGASGVLTVADRNIITGEITWSANSGAITAGYYLVPNGQYGLRMNGLGDILNNNSTITVNTNYIVRRALTSLGGLSRATYPGLKSTIVRLGNGTATDITEANLFGFIAALAANLGNKTGATTMFCHPFTLVSIWNLISKIRTAKVSDAIKLGAAGEASIEFPLLKGVGKITGVLGWKKYCLSCFDFSNKKESAMRTVVPGHFIDQGENGVWKYMGGENAAHAWAAFYDTIISWPFNPRMCGELTDIQLPSEYQIA